MQPHGLARPDLRDPVDVLVDHHADHRIAAGDGMVGTENHRKTVRRHLNRPAGGALAGQLAVAASDTPAACRPSGYRPGRCGW